MFYYSQCWSSLLCLLLFTLGYRANDIRECMGIVCNNGGIVDNSDGFCSCLCPENTTGLLCDYQLQESAFPRGAFALPMSTDGCPEEIAQGWTSGFINITTVSPIDDFYNESCGFYKENGPLRQEDDIGQTYILGPFDRYTLQLNFCFKDVDHTLNSNADWPSGLYGIYGTKEGCPSGFNELNLTLCLPRLLHYNMDGSLPKLNIEENESFAVINVTYCRRIADSGVDAGILGPFFNTSNPFVLIKDPEMEPDSCHTREGYNVTEEYYPLQLAFSDGEQFFQLHFCRYVPETYDTAKQQLQESAFPRGSYALPMSKDGCPEETAQGWTPGFINITTAYSIDYSINGLCGFYKENGTLRQEDDIGQTYILGPFDRYTIQLNFCFKDVDHTLNSDTDWPSGLYGIYGTEEGCPSGFNELNLTLCLPRLLHYNMDGSLPKLNIEEKGRFAEINITYCRRIADFRVDAGTLGPFFNTSNPFVLIKDPEMEPDSCHTREGYNVTEEYYPLQLAFSIGENIFELHFCRYVPETYDTAIQRWDVFPGTLLPFLDISLHIGSCGDHVIGSIITSCEEVEVWVMIDAGKTVQVSGVMWSYEKRHFYRSILYDSLTHVFVERKPRSFLRNGALLCIYYPPKTIYLQSSLTEICMCTRSFLGRYVTLVFRFRNFEETKIFSGVVIYILSNDEEFGMADNECSKQIGMRNLYTRDFQITASSNQDMYTPSSARLWIPGLSGWCAKSNDKNPFIQVDVGIVSIISGVTMSNWENLKHVYINNTYQGIIEYYGVTAFSIEYGTNQNYLRQYNNRGFIYDRSQQVGMPQTFLLQTPILAKYVRIYPKPRSPSERPCLKFELLGCIFGFDKNTNNKIRLDETWKPYFVGKMKTVYENMITGKDFPVKEDRNSFNVWKIMNNKQKYVQLQFFDIHLRAPQDVTDGFVNQNRCKDSIFISTSEIKNPFIKTNPDNFFHLDSLYNNKVPRFIPTREKGEPVFLSFFVCSTHEGKDEDGAAFRVLVSYIDYSVCRDDCALADMKLITGNFLGHLDSPKMHLYWTIDSDYTSIVVVLKIEDFDVSCYTGSEFYINQQKYCNQNVSLEEKSFWTGFFEGRRNPRIYVRFDKQNNIPEDIRVFPEGLQISYRLLSFYGRASYKMISAYGWNAWVGVTVCPRETGKCYHFEHDHSKTWIDIAKICEKRNSLLINFNSPEELHFVRSALRYFYQMFIERNIVIDMEVFIGLSRYVDTSGRLKEQWIDGSPLSFTAWGENEPSDVGLKECTMMKMISNIHPEDTSSWYTTSCDHVFEEESIYICEEDKRDATFTDNSFDITDIWLLEDITSKLDPAVVFKCSSGEWMSHMVRCNGLKECRDGSDEMNCTDESMECDENKFSCTDGQCIHISQVCDHRVDCSDASDEYCSFPECNRETEYTCNNGQCVELTARCDSYPDCFDGSDEISCTSCNQERAFQCGDKSCISKRLVCDKMNDCPDAGDERSCDRKYETCDDFWRDGYADTNGKEYTTDGNLHIVCHLNMTDKMMHMSLLNSDWTYKWDRTYKIIIPDTIQAARRNNYYCSQMLYKKPQRGQIFGNEFDVVIGGYRKSFSHGGVFLPKEQNSFSLDFITKMVSDKVLYQSGEWGSISIDKVVTGLTVTLTENFTSFEDGIAIGNVICTKEFDQTHSLLPCGRGLKAISEAERCLYNLHPNRVIDGCRTLNHLQNCENFRCPWDYFKCGNSYCIPQMYVCNGYADCPNAEDETVCRCSNNAFDVTGILVPSSSFIPAERANKLYEIAFRLGGSFFTRNKTTYVLKVSKGQNQTSLTIDKTRILSKSERITNIYHRHFIEYYDNILQILFGNSFQTIGLVWILDEPEFSDAEQLLAAKLENSSNILYFNRIVIDNKVATEGKSVDKTTIYDREITLKNQDVVGTLGAFLFPDICEGETLRCLGHFRCKLSTVCIQVAQVCDGKNNCPFGDDETYCDFQCPEGCSCGAFILNCLHIFMNSTIRISPDTRSIDSSYAQQLCVALLVDQMFSLPALTKLNASSCQLEELDRYSFQKIQNLLVLDISFNKLRKLKRDTFSLLKHLQSLYLANNKLLKEIEPGAFNGLQIKSLFINNANIRTLEKNTFAGLNLTILDLSRNKIKSIENFAFSGLETNQINIENNEITDFSEGIFEGIENLAYLKTSSFKFCCVRPPYLSEENCYPPKDEFSSCEHLMRNITLKALLWTIGTLALVGNILSIFFRLVYDRARLKLGYGVFVTNLAISDLLMGIYLLVIAIADKIFEGRYVEFDEYWRQSVWCQCAGLLATLSSEASVLLMVLITIDRIIVIKFPFGKVRFNTNSAVLSALGCWLVALTVALVPMLYKEYFKNFYGKSAVCLALPLTNDRPQGWLYSLVIFIFFNMLAFVLIAAGQWLIYNEVKKSAKVKGKRKQAARINDLKIARNLLMIVSTDFVCWFPIGLMGFLSMAGYEISDVVYAWTAVLILPFNSALNPFLYTFMTIVGKKNFTPNVTEQESMEKKEVTPEALLNVTRFISDHAKRSSRKMVTLSEVLQDQNLTVNEILDLAYNTFKYMALLEECCLTLDGINEHKRFLQLRKNNRVRVNTLFIGKPVKSLKKTKQAENMYAVGVFLEKILKQR